MQQDVLTKIQQDLLIYICNKIFQQRCIDSFRQRRKKSFKKYRFSVKDAMLETALLMLGPDKHFSLKEEPKLLLCLVEHISEYTRLLENHFQSIITKQLLGNQQSKKSAKRFRSPSSKV